MNIQVRLAEPFWRAVGQRNLEIKMEEGATVADLLTLLQKRYPALSQELVEAPPIIFVGDEDVEMETLLVEKERVHLVWAIAGG